MSLKDKIMIELRAPKQIIPRMR